MEFLRVAGFRPVSDLKGIPLQRVEAEAIAYMQERITLSTLG